MALGHASVQTKGVKTAWETLIEHFGNEVEALIYAEPEALKIVDRKIVNAILAFRKDDVIIHPGGGGQYGWLELPEHLKIDKDEPVGRTSEEKKRASKGAKKEKENPGSQISFSDLEIKRAGKTLKASAEKATGAETKKPEEENVEKTAGQKSLFDF
ncbi:hypothetical protein SDC9_150607 [bioreactor metagenome]|uniref:Uncharacterized protein n=1 Tax=bioreactor metagenome TaxID=1076179 RepID=A0A645EMY1_9ZZZZ